jgi:hypothetical protein
VPGLVGKDLDPNFKSVCSRPKSADILPTQYIATLAEPARAETVTEEEAILSEVLEKINK